MTLILSLFSWLGRRPSVRREEGFAGLFFGESIFGSLEDLEQRRQGGPRARTLRCGGVEGDDAVQLIESVGCERAAGSEDGDGTETDGGLLREKAVSVSGPAEGKTGRRPRWDVR